MKTIKMSKKSQEHLKESCDENNWVGEHINGRTVVKTWLAVGNEKWKEERKRLNPECPTNIAAPEQDLYIEFDDGKILSVSNFDFGKHLCINHHDPEQ
jgi:hypothetical protein